MRREKYIDDYEDFEPEISIWPFLLLSFLLPLVPFVMNIVLGSNGFSLLLVMEYVVAFFPLFSTSLSMKDGEKVWMFVLSSAFYFLLVLVLWAYLKMNSSSLYVLGLPFPLALSGVTLSLSAVAFFNKRRRRNWLGWALLSLLLSLLLTFLTYLSTEGKGLLWILYPSLTLLLSIFIFFVNRRTESTPWYIVIVLVLLTLSSFTLYPSFVDTLLSDGNVEAKLSAAIKAFLYSFSFWYSLSFLFVFAGLAGKSSYKKERVEDNDTETESFSVPPVNAGSDRFNAAYTNPPEYSRFNASGNVPPSAEPPRRKEESAAQERAPSENSAGDDKWYSFIEGGVGRESDRRQNTARDDERSYRRDERDYRRDERDYYRRDDRDYRRDDRDYYRRDDRDYYRDERDYRRDDRDYYRRDDRDYRRDDRDYPARRYDRDRDWRDDDYPPYDDRRPR